VVAAPANGFGPGGEGFVRLTVCAPEERIREAVERIKHARL
jgi:aspartate/methionine/tyrosine aminotransferase